MSTDTERPAAEASSMDEYERQVWKKLNDHWQHRSNRRGLPNWVSAAAGRTGEVAGSVANGVASVVPEGIKAPLRSVGEAIGNRAVGPALRGATHLVELVNDWALELNNPEGVEKLVRKQGIEIGSFTELRLQDLKTCDRLLTSNTLKWRTAGAVEGGAMGALALVPIAGIPVAITADVLVIQVLSTAIAARIAYSYGYDAKDPAEQAFIERLVRRSFMAQALKAKPLNDAAKAAAAVKDRVRWSPKLRADHPLLVGLEKLLQQLGPAGAKVSVESVAKVVPFVGIVVGAGMNSTILANVAADAQRYCQTRFLCEKHNLPLPAALAFDIDDNQPDD